MGGEKREGGGGGGGGGDGGGDRKRQKKQYISGRGKGQFSRSGGPRTAGFERLRTVGVKGVLVSCDVRSEPMCQSECCMAFAEKAERRYPDLFKDPEDEAAGGDNIEAEIAKEAAAAAEDAALFQCVTTNIKGLVFIEFKAEMDPLLVCKDLIQEVQKLGRTKTKYATRATPVLGTSYARLADIVAATKPIVDKFLGAGVPATKYSVLFKRRSNNEVDRMEVIKAVADLADKKHTVDLTTPDVCILIDILTNICLIGVAEDYFALKKYNIQELAGFTAKTSTTMLAGGRVKPAGEEAAEKGEKGEKEEKEEVEKVEKAEAGAEVKDAKKEEKKEEPKKVEEAEKKEKEEEKA